MLIRQMIQRLCEINSYLAGSKHDTPSFEEVLPLFLFYRDFSDTNVLVREASCLAKVSILMLINDMWHNENCLNSIIPIEKSSSILCIQA